MAGTTSMAIVAVAVAACSSASSSTSSTSDAAGGTSTSATAACVAAANNYLKPWQTPPTTLSSHYTPLPSKPPTGKLVIKLVNGTIPSPGKTEGTSSALTSQLGGE